MVCIIEPFKKDFRKAEFGIRALTYLHPLDAAAFFFFLSALVGLAIPPPPPPSRQQSQHTPLRNDDVDILMINSCLVELGHVSGHIFIDSF